MSLTQKFKDAVCGAAVNVTSLHRHAVPGASMRTYRYQVRDVRASNPPRGSGGQCNQDIPAAPLRHNNYGRGYGGYKCPHHSVLPYVQREECNLHRPVLQMYV